VYHVLKIVTPISFWREIYKKSPAQISRAPKIPLGLVGMALQNHSTRDSRPDNMATTATSSSSTDEVLAKCIEQLHAFKYDMNHRRLHFSTTLTSAERKALHQECEAQNLYSQSVGVGKERHLVASKLAFTPSDQTFEVTDEDRAEFMKYANGGRHIQTFVEPYFSYAVDKLGLRDQYALFDDMLRTHGRGYIARIVNDMVDVMNKTDGIEKLRTFQFDPKEKLEMPPRNKIHSKRFDDDGQLHYYLSVDMIKANFNSARLFDSSLTLGHATWDALVGQVTQDAFLLQSKHFREVVFGKLSCHARLAALYRRRTSALYKHVKEDLVVFCGTDDELVIGTTEDTWREDLATLKRLVASHNEKEANIWRCEAFTLQDIGKSHGKLWHNLETDETKLKGLDPSWHMQALCWLAGETIPHETCKIMVNGHLATFDKPFEF
jgi:hypothetical protein